MKTLTVLRHAKSGWDDHVARDFDRPLNPKGHRAAQVMGRHLRDRQYRFDRIVASPAQRVVETLAGVADGYGEALAIDWDRRLYLASAATLLDCIHELSDAHEQVLLVGHNPGLEDLVLSLVPDDGSVTRDAVEAKYPTATIARMSWDGDWTTIRTGGATLESFVRPRDLDPSLGPDEF
jgi:phosphohistidine phosphatase